MKELTIKNLCAELKARRLDLGINQRELAEKIGVGTSYINEIECGRGNVRLDRLAQIFEALGYRLEYSILKDPLISNHKNG